MKSVAFFVSLATMVLFGAFDMTRGVAAPLMQSDWQLTYVQLGGVFAANSLGYIVGSFLCGLWVDRIGVRFALLGGVITLVAGLMTFLVSHLFGWVVAGFLIYGFGGGWLEIGVNTVVPRLTDSARQKSSYFNILHGLYGVGAFAFPGIVVWLIHVWAGWRPVYMLLAGLVLVVGMVAFLSRDPVFSLQHGRQTQTNTDTGLESDITVLHAPLHTAALDIEALDTEALHTQALDIKALDAEARSPQSPSTATTKWYRSPMLYVFLACISAYVMAEAGVAAWLPEYVVQVRHGTVASGSVYLSGFYLTFTVGRLSAPLWVSRMGEYVSIGAAAALAFVTTLLALTGASMLPLFFVAGFGFSIIFPTIASAASHAFHENAGSVIGMLFTAAGIGSMVVNAWIGWLSTAYGLSIGFSSIVWFLGLVNVSCWLAYWFVRKSNLVRTVSRTEFTPAVDGPGRFDS